ncbi:MULTISPECIES: DUF3873 family protein [Bacteroides]|uniref:DUF3873 family protein n=1 Tax=Bacteroides TaxID=816 RepID=UPI0026DF72E6|nr:MULTISPECIES: DUF3873 family protein [Bacteroides]MCS2261921.1 DUF3873 domain-containing protein [Bacteroides thetaiotaomicron]MDO5418502.1 DUF3873 family protein [Bacteroides sp.]MEE0575191.1 DUF3873 family protein [Paraprevotella clara]
MATRMTVNGVSTCTKAGAEKYEAFEASFGRKKRTLIQYDYRAENNELFSCICPTLEQCRAKRDEWLNRKAKEGK